jgi:hypothetical protein
MDLAQSFREFQRRNIIIKTLTVVYKLDVQLDIKKGICLKKDWFIAPKHTPSIRNSIKICVPVGKSYLKVDIFGSSILKFMCVKDINLIPQIIIQIMECYDIFNYNVILDNISCPLLGVCKRLKFTSNKKTINQFLNNFESSINDKIVKLDKKTTIIFNKDYNIFNYIAPNCECIIFLDNIINSYFVLPHILYLFHNNKNSMFHILVTDIIDTIIYYLT